MELQAEYFLKYFKKKPFQYQDPHVLIDFRVCGMYITKIAGFTYYEYNIVCEKAIIRNFISGLYDTPITDKKKLLSVRRTNLYLRVDTPQIIKPYFTIFDRGKSYRLVTKNVRWALK